jgi:hypothetical protein
MVDVNKVGYDLTKALLKTNQEAPDNWDAPTIVGMIQAGGTSAALFAIALSFHSKGMGEQEIHDALASENLGLATQGATSRVLIRMMNLNIQPVGSQPGR